MFSRKNRIPRTALEEIMKQKAFLRGDFFNVKQMVTPLGYPRVSVVVSKKVTKSSVKRHFIKRKFVSAIRNYFDLLGSKDYVFLINKEAADVDFKTIKTSLSNFLSKDLS